MTILPPSETPEQLVDRMTTNGDFGVLQEPRPATRGRDLAGTSFLETMSATAEYRDAGCPANARCADFLTVPERWGSDFFRIGMAASDHAAVEQGGRRGWPLVVAEPTVAWAHSSCMVRRSALSPAGSRTTHIAGSRRRPCSRRSLESLQAPVAAGPLCLASNLHG
jgi:hypothetical protein